MKKIFVLTTTLLFFFNIVSAQEILREKTFNLSFDTITDKMEKNLSKYYGKNIAIRTSLSNGQKGGHASINWDTVYDENGEFPQRDKFKLFVREVTKNSTSVKLFYEFEYTSNGTYVKADRDIMATCYNDMWTILGADKESSVKEKEYKREINGKQISSSVGVKKEKKKKEKEKKKKEPKVTVAPVVENNVTEVKEVQEPVQEVVNAPEAEPLTEVTAEPEIKVEPEPVVVEEPAKQESVVEEVASEINTEVEIKPEQESVKADVIVPVVEEKELVLENKDIAVPHEEPVENIAAIATNEQVVINEEFSAVEESVEQTVEEAPAVASVQQETNLSVETEQNIENTVEESKAEELSKDDIVAAKIRKQEELKQQKAELAAQKQKEKEELAAKKEEERQAAIAAKLQKQEELKQQKAELAAQKQREKEELAAKKEEERQAAIAAKLQKEEELKMQKEAELAAIKQKEEEDLKRLQEEQAAFELQEKQRKEKEHEELEKSKIRTYNIPYAKVYTIMLKNISKNVRGVQTADEEKGLIVSDWTYSGNALQSHKAKRRYRITLDIKELSENQTSVSAETRFEMFLVDWKEHLYKDTFLTDYYNSLFYDLEEGLK